MTDQLMQEVTSAAINLQRAAALEQALRREIKAMREEISSLANQLEAATSAYEQARTRLTRASLALHPDTSLETTNG